MKNGQEFNWDFVNDRATINIPIANRMEMMHLDLKPDNNFGHAEDSDPAIQGPQLDQQKLDIRDGTGTEDYFPPEQFSETWNASDWRSTGIAGEFSSATNVWGIGVIMYQLICLTKDPPKHLRPFKPDYDINGAPAKGNAYGPEIQIQDYSATIRDLIQECLYEKPAHRCSLMDMKTTIRRQIDVHFRANINNHVGEDCPSRRRDRASPQSPPYPLPPKRSHKPDTGNVEETPCREILTFS
ncbi:hypothetical protein BUE80_DR012414 [Diplocarpon rosae]|nr:hypothetical protein BUE80_DR012414 [Diplocarpon rosae]